MIEIKHRAIKAVRRNRICEWCGERINKGDPAHYRVYCYDGFTTEYMHPECYDAMQETEEDVSDGWMPGDFPRGSVISWDNMTEAEKEEIWTKTLNL